MDSISFNKGQIKALPSTLLGKVKWTVGVKKTAMLELWMRIGRGDFPAPLICLAIWDFLGGVSNGREQDDLAGVFGLGVKTRYQANDRMAIVAVYQMMWIQGVALAALRANDDLSH